MIDLRRVSTGIGFPIGVLSSIASLDLEVGQIRGKSIFEIGKATRDSMRQRYSSVFRVFHAALTWQYLVGFVYEKVLCQAASLIRKGQHDHMWPFAVFSNLGPVTNRQDSTRGRASIPALISDDTVSKLPKIVRFFGIASENTVLPTQLITSATVDGNLCIATAASSFFWTEERLEAFLGRMIAILDQQ